MPKTITYPPKLVPYITHGLDLQIQEGSNHTIAECPFCGKEGGKFRINVATGLGDCKRCLEGSNKGGFNITTFLRRLHELELEGTSQPTKGHIALAKARKLLSPATLLAWGVVQSSLSGEWVVPGYNHGLELCQLYRYETPPGGNKPTLLATPTLSHGLFGGNLWKDSKPDVYLCEGPWDAMALWEVLRLAKRRDDGSLGLTGSPEGSLQAEANVLAVPGCTTFNEHWLPLFAGRRVFILYDNDHPKETNGKVIEGAGITGVKRVARMLLGSTEPPKEVQYLAWGPEGYSRDLPSGHDVRDALTAGEAPSARIGWLEELFECLKPIPDTWGVSKPGLKNGEVIELLPCTTWNTLVQEGWRKALKWGDGLDRALSVMLACITSTKAVGDQLWAKIIGPPACLDGETPIYDPIANTVKTIRDRWAIAEKFYVYSRKPNGRIGICQALPPQRFDKAAMYEVTFASGRQIRVTGGHQFWNGDSYVDLGTIACEQLLSGPYHLPTILDTDLQAHGQDAPHLMKTTEGYSTDYYACSYPYDEQPQLDQGISLDVSPLQDGVQEHSQHDWREDGLNNAHKCTLPYFVHLSSLDCSRLLELLQNVGEFAPQKYEDTYEQSYVMSSFVGLFSQLTYQRCIAYTSSQFWMGAICQNVSLPRFSQGPEVQLWKSLEILDNNHEWNIQAGSNPLSPESLIGKSNELLLCASLRQHCEDTFVVPHYRPEEFDNTQLTSFQNCKETQLAVCERQTRGLPYITPIRVNNIDLGSSILAKTDAIVKVEYVGEMEYYDFHVPETENYWACGFFHHNCGKSTLCEALSTAKRFVTAKSTIRGFHSGFKSDSDGSEDNSLLATLKDKTLVTKDGDTLLQSPNLGQILSEARDIYDRVSRTHYRNKMSKDYDGINLTWLLCGTSSLRCLDSSELGERFLDCVIIDQVDEDEEDEVGWRIANRADRELSLEADGKMETRDSPEMVKAKLLTGGYVEYLRTNAQVLLDAVTSDPESLRRCQTLAKFVAYMRARPSKKQEEKAERELSYRLISQLVRLAKCLAVVLNRPTLDAEVMRRVELVALDTARGRTLNLVKVLYEAGGDGADTETLALKTGEGNDGERKLLLYLRKIGVTMTFKKRLKDGTQTRQRWKLTERMRLLYSKVLNNETKPEP